MFITFKGEKLIRKSNYIEQLNLIDLYLEINGYMPYVNGSAIPLIRDLYYKKVEKFDKDGKNYIVWDAYSLELTVKYYEKLK